MAADGLLQGWIAHASFRRVLTGSAQNG